MARRSSKARRHPKAKPQGILELNAQGFGFVKTAEGEFFIPASKVNGAFPGDLVEISRLSGQSPDRHYSEASRKPSARVARVIMRARDTLIGRYEVAEPFGVVVPEDPSVPCDIFTLRSDAPHVNDGDLVEVRIIEFPTRNSAATGTVVRVFGSESDTDIAIDLIIADHRFETEFSPAALEEAEHCSLDASLATVQGYRDLRDEFILLMLEILTMRFPLSARMATLCLVCISLMCLDLLPMTHRSIWMHGDAQPRCIWWTECFLCYRRN